MKNFSLLRYFTLAIIVLVLIANTLKAGIPPNYYTPVNGLTGAPLKTALHNIIRNHTRKTYDYLWTAFYTTDDKTPLTVWDMYSDIPDGTPPYVYDFGTDQCATTPGHENGCYNREHTFPKSWWGGGDLAADTMYTDLFHIVPTDSYVNSRRSNYPYGQVGTATWTSLNGSKLGPCTTPGYTGTAFEPRDEFKGDVARNVLYMATRYESRIDTWQIYPEANVVLDGTSYPCFDQWHIDLLLAWNASDPVSQKEIDRNEAVYLIQLNRNPFIDHPEYVNQIWGPTGAPVEEPANHASSFSAHTITLNWTDATGDVVPNGYLIRMSAVGFNNIAIPADGVLVADDAFNKNIAPGIQTCTFGELTPGTVYYFKIYGYTINNGLLDYKTDGTPMQTSIIAN
jgi:endonuclease I